MSNNKYYNDDLPLVNFSNKDPWTINDAYMGSAIFGGTGSGKTSGSGRTIAHAFLRAGFGGLVLCAKPGEADRWEQYCKETGRQKSFMCIGSGQNGNDRRFNFLEYELARTDGGTTSTPFALEALMKVHEAMNLIDGVKEGESFWTNNVRLLISHSIDSLYAAYGRFSLSELKRFIDSAPSNFKESGNSNWQQSSFHYQTIKKAWYTPVKPLNDGDREVIMSYFQGEGFAKLAPSTRSGIVATLNAMVMDFEKGDLRRIFCTSTNFVPEMSHQGAVIVLDFPLKEWQRGGQLAQHVFKFAWQRAIERRKVENNTRPCFLWSDEYQLFVSSYDADFQSTARESRACSVIMTQSISALRDAVKTPNPEDMVNGLLNNFQTKIIHTCTDPVTQMWAADHIGKGIQYLKSTNIGKNRSIGSSIDKSGLNVGENTTESVTTQEVWDYFLQPSYFGNNLRMGGKNNKFIVDGVIIQGGRKWKSSPNEKWIQCGFNQRS